MLMCIKIKVVQVGERHLWVSFLLSHSKNIAIIIQNMVKLKYLNKL